MRTLVSVMIFLFAGLSFASTPSGLPSFDELVLEKQLEEQLPEYQESNNGVKRGLSRFRIELENYRQGVLEGFNQAVIEYRQKLVRLDEKLELDRKMGKINQKEYLRQHNYIERELRKSRGSGEYMRAYFEYLGIYKTLSDWVIENLHEEERIIG